MKDYKGSLELFLHSLGKEPVREYKFHPTRKWRIDYAFPEDKIAIEYEGMAFFGGKSRHTTITGFTNDCEKYNELAIMGWRVLRLNAKLLDAGTAWGQIERIFGE